MNILYTNFHTGASVGGHTVYIASLARALAHRHRVTVAAPPGSGLFQRASQIPAVTVVAQLFPNRLAKLIAAARALREVIRRRAIDVVHVNGSADHRLAILATVGMGRQRPRIVLTKHNDLRMSWLGGGLRARLGTDHVIGVCDFVKHMLLDSPYAACPISTIPNGVDTDRYMPGESDASRALRCAWVGSEAQGRKLILGSNAGTDDYKGWMDMVAAVASLPADLGARIHVVLAGKLPSDAQREAVRLLGMQTRVTFTGPLADVRPFIAAMDVGFVLSYRIDTISFACREMMAMGKPVIVSRHGGLPENITPGVDGWVVASRAPHEVAAVLSHLLQYPGQLSRKGRMAREKSLRQFGIASFVSQTDAVYRGLARM